MKNEHKNEIPLINELSDLRKKVQKLEASEIEFSRLKSALSIVYDAIDSTVGGVIITNLEGTISYVNHSFLRIFEYNDKHEVLGKNAGELFEKDTIKGLKDVKTVIDLTDSGTHEFIVKCKDKTTFPVEISVSNVTNSEREIVGRMASFVDITKRKRAEKEQEKLIRKLERALDKIKTLRGLIPICAACKKIRDDKGYWHQVEVYVRDHSEADFSHDICPECAQKLYPDLFEEKES